MDRDAMTHQSFDPRGRRGFLRQVVSATAAVPLAPVLAGGAVTSALAANAAAASTGACKPEPADNAAAYISLSREEAAFVETMVNIMCPADEMTPNGVDCGLPVYIDRQLAGDFG